MKTGQMGVLVIFVAALVFGTSLLTAGPQPENSFFNKSLHHRGEGMRYWYEKDDGFMQITGVPYDKLDCKNCHIKTCDPCHAEKRNDTIVFSTEKARNIETCLQCHGREGLSMKIDKQVGADDVHFAAGMSCAECHGGEDVHGDGNEYTSMRQPGAVKAKCENCHTEEAEDAPAFERDIKAHMMHSESHHCAACHVQSTMACLNCHFGEYLATGEKNGNFIPVKEWLLLINHEGKVTSGTAMTFVHKNVKDTGTAPAPFVVYAPYFTHSVSKKGRDCGSCHGTEAVKKIQKGEEVRMSSFKEGKLESSKWVVPVVPNLLRWEYLDKVKGDWVALPVKGEVKSQMVGYGTPLRQSQLKKLAYSTMPKSIRNKTDN